MTSLPTPLASAAWLAAELGAPDLVPVDASWYLPLAGRDPRTEFFGAHIPGAVFWDLDALSATGTDLPHMMPAPAMLAEQVGGLGISAEDRVVVYDGSGNNLSAARVWWMLRALGHRDVAVLDGGFAAWRAGGNRVEAGAPARRPVAYAVSPPTAAFLDRARLEEGLAHGRFQVLDARSRGRFEGSEPEPRTGVRSGHIPGSLNLPYPDLVNPDGTLRSPDELSRLFEQAGLDLDQPVVTSCGSGVSACALILALEVIGHQAHAVYDGSWAEYGRVDG